MHLEFEFCNSIKDFAPCEWHALAQDAGPFLQHAFLLALEDSGSVSATTGWQPMHLAVRQGGRLVAAVPAYSKSHSYGEYVFDFSWANAYHQHGLAYYPKFLCAIPFTPVTGPRLLALSETDTGQVVAGLVNFLHQQLPDKGYSSAHWLFVEHDAAKLLEQHGFCTRYSVQFQWFNRGYPDFGHFLQHLTARRRKSIRKERQKILQQDVVIERVSGSEILAQHQAVFYQCYCQTYLKRSGHEGYLNEAFFAQLFESMSEQILLVNAYRQDIPIASALFLFDETQLCGRYWGALEDIDALHFECCYYQGIEFCIQRGIESFNPGTQGEHKILRGFEPIYCYSCHWMAEPAFHDAIARFNLEEARDMDRYKAQAKTLLPFKLAD